MPSSDFIYYLVTGKSAKTLRVQKMRLVGDHADAMDDAVREAALAFMPAGCDVLPFDLGYRCDPGEVFSVASELPQYLVPCRDHPDTVPDAELTSVPDDTPDTFYGLICVERLGQGPIWFFRLTAPFTFARRTVLWWFDGQGFGVERAGTIVLPDQPVAKWQDRRIYFANEPAVRSFFEIEGQLQTATPARLNELEAMYSVCFTDKAATARELGPQLRKLLEVAIQRDILGRVSVKTVVETAKSRGIEIAVAEVEGQLRLVLPADKAGAKAVLQVLAQRHVDCPMTKDKLAANSTLVIAKGASRTSEGQGSAHLSESGAEQSAVDRELPANVSAIAPVRRASRRQSVK